MDSPSPDLRAEWSDLLRRRPAFAEPLAVYGAVLEVWNDWAVAGVAVLDWSADACRARWQRGAPLLADPAVFSVDASEVEGLVGSVMETLAPVVPGHAEGLQRFAEAWDAGVFDVAALLPRPGRIGDGTAERVSGLPAALVAFLAYACLRPVLERYFEGCRRHLDDDAWSLGVCPFCGGPAGFSDIVENGARRLACHLCGGRWPFARLQCVFCGTDRTGDLIRLAPEQDPREEGYAVAGCKRCRGYLKELDRRVRWNAAGPLVEDWGSPHLDLIAAREGYWRAVPSLVQLATTA
ncbi:MAG TPA: formate dehydrogenase accessory protein FdhE [Candidatus Limnocylindria bacterium]|nr:formate dehydrogenase accessory protein FdhE [Candidatus Limnocylindria bacterium]